MLACLCIWKRRGYCGSCSDARAQGQGNSFRVAGSELYLHGLGLGLFVLSLGASSWWLGVSMFLGFFVSCSMVHPYVSRVVCSPAECCQYLCAVLLLVQMICCCTDNRPALRPLLTVVLVAAREAFQILKPVLRVGGWQVQHRVLACCGIARSYVAATEHYTWLSPLLGVLCVVVACSRLVAPRVVHWFVKAKTPSGALVAGCTRQSGHRFMLLRPLSKVGHQ